MTGGDTGGSTTATDGGADVAAGCAGFSDDFSGTTLDPCWTTLNGAGSSNPLLLPYLSNGALHLQAEPTPDGVWFQGSTRSMVYKVVTAMRFKVTTTVHPRKRTDPTSVPTQLHVGGLMVRNPSSAGGATENYLFIMCGHPEGSSGVAHQGIEVKSTTNGGSAYKEPDFPANDADLRMCRIDGNFYLYARPAGTTTWTLIDQAGNAMPVSRPDLPATVQLGMALNFSAGADLDVAFDQITMAATPPATAADCTAD
jgi:hypothetical protein